MDTQSIVAIVVGAVIVLVGFLFFARHYDAVKGRIRHGDSEAGFEVERQRPDPQPARSPPATGAVGIGGSVKNTSDKTQASGALEDGVGSVSIGGDVEGGSITTKVERQ